MRVAGALMIGWAQPSCTSAGLCGGGGQQKTKLALIYLSLILGPKW